MNRYLLAGAAAVALFAGATAAQAQTSPIEVRIGGDAYFEAGYVSEDNDAGKKDGDFRDRYRLNIVVTGKASDTLSYGARMRLRANAGGGANLIDADRGYMFINSKTFGAINLGTHTSYNDNEGYVTRPINYIFLAQFDNIGSWAGDTALMASSLTDNGLGTKIYYVTPTMSGFKAGLTFTPDSGSVLNNVSRDDVVATSRFENVWEAGLNYDNTFSGVRLRANVAYMTGEAKPVSTAAAGQYEDLSAWQAGLMVDYAGVSAGVGYILKDGANGTAPIAKTARYKSDTEIVNAGLSYTTGPLTVGMGYIYGEREGSVTTAANLEQTVWSLGAAYTVAPGLSVGAEYANVDITDGTSVTSATNNNANVFILRTFASF